MPVTALSIRVFQRREVVKITPDYEFPFKDYDPFSYSGGKEVKLAIDHKFVDEERDLFYSALNIDPECFRKSITVYIDTYPGRYGELFTSEHYASQLKLGRALLRLGMHHSTMQINK